MRNLLRVVLTMTSLKAAAKIVEKLLRENEHTRNSDSYLYLKVLEQIDESLCQLPVRAFLNSMGDFKVPTFETVRRARQKLQAQYPELASCEKVQEGRLVNEERYRDFAKGI